MYVNRLIIKLASCLILTGIVLLGGCGGGGGGGNSSTPPSTFQLTIDAAGVPSGATLGTIQGIITVPVGVGLKTSATGEVQDGLIKAAGVAATGAPQVIGNFNPDTRQLTVNVVSPSAGFGNGPCAIVIFDIATGATVTAADFTVTSVQARDYTSASAVAGVTINLK